MPIFLCTRLQVVLDLSRACNADHTARTCDRSVYSINQNNNIVWLSNMADKFLWEIHKVRKGLWAFFSSWFCFWMLIGSAGKLWSHGLNYHIYLLYQETLEAIQRLAQCLATHPSAFSYAGVKDSKADTTQFVVVRGITPEQYVTCCPCMHFLSVHLYILLYEFVLH